VRLSQVAVPLVRLGTLLALSFIVFAASYARLTQTEPPLAVLLYCARLSGIGSLIVFALSGLLQIIERNASRGRLTSTACALALLMPIIYAIAAHVAAGDGLRARGIPAWLIAGIGVAALSLTVVIVWTYRFWARRRPLDVLFALVAIAGLTLADALLSRAQRELVTLLELLSIVLASQLILNLLGDNPRRQLRVGLFGCLLSCTALVIGLAAPELVASGRRRALVAESSAAFVDALLFGPLRSRLAPRVDRARCDTLNAPQPAPPLALSSEQRRNVILISIDTLRADFVESKANGQLLMPNLVGFAREARYAPRAQAAFPATMLSISAAFSGFMPSDLLLAPKPLPTIFTLARGRMDQIEAVLPSGRYFTRPDVQAYLLTGAQVQLAGNGRQQTGYAIERLRQLRAENKRHLLWIHYYEPHGPYKTRAPFEFGDSELGRYRSEIASVDAQLGSLFEVLRGEGWFDDSLIVVFADHGEAFGEHNHFRHHYLLYPWLVNVPLIWRAPASAPARVSAPVHLMDVAPTVLHFLGLPSPGGMRGQSLLAQPPPATRSLFSEEISISGHIMHQYRLHPATDEAELFKRLMRLEDGPGYASKLALRRDDLYFIQQRASLAGELYAWRNDPGARHDLADSEREQTAALEREAAQFRSDVFERAACALESKR
jgi:arylsulfatase A-like enzyme